MRAYGWFGFFLLLISECSLFLKVEPFYSWFYCFAWWSYILLADNLLFALRGRSLFIGRQQELRRLIPLSVFVWVLFEAYNLVICSWAYDGVSPNPWVRWSGYALAFATVLPGIFITSDLLEYLLFRPRDEPAASECEPLTPEPRSLCSRLYLALGIILSAAPLVWPRFFFSTVWLGPIFLLDPMLEKLGIRSLSLSIASGNRRRVWSLLLGGIACGLMWEFWNFWAPSRWIYTVPFFRNLKLFEMPVLGFLGFPPFALECWILYHLLVAAQRKLNSVPARLAFWLAVGLVCAAVFLGIDYRTVQRFATGCHRSAHLWSLG
jgi:hypothetical protein